jgi:hypothetical protein
VIFGHSHPLPPHRYVPKDRRSDRGIEEPAHGQIDEIGPTLYFRTRLLTEPGFERFPEHAFMVRLISGNAGVIFQLQHLLNHAHSIRRTLRLMFLVPDGKTTLRLACPAFIEDMPITVS